ncbi:MAG: hypothetical protein ACRYG6_06865 [Janthinobacterium lividum]
MTALFASGRVVDLILLLVLAEAAALLALHRATGRGPRPAALLPNLAAGACLLLALRFGLRGAAWPVLALCLLGSLAAHLADLRARWGKPARPGSARTRQRPEAFGNHSDKQTGSQAGP